MLSGLKRLVFVLMLIGLCLGGLEFLALAAYRLVQHKPFDRKQYESSMLSIADPAQTQTRVAAAEVLGGRTTETLHPYFGYVHNPEEPGVSDYGFYDEGSPLTRRQTNKIGRAHV